MAETISLITEVVPQLNNAEQAINDFKQREEEKPISLGIEIKDLERAKEEIKRQLSDNLEGIPEGFSRIKQEINKIKTGELKGMTQSIETFSDGTNQLIQRIVVFKEQADGSFQAVDGRIQKSVEHLNNYQQAMELTAKKLSTLNTETKSLKIFDENGKWTGGWEQVTDSIMSSNQELKTVVREEEEAGVLVRKIHQEIRALNEDLTPKEGFQLFGKESIERINLAEQAYRKLNETLRQQKKLQEEIKKITLIDKTGAITGTKGTSVERTFKTVIDQYGNEYQTITNKFQNELGQTIEQVNAKIRQQGKDWEWLGQISKKVSTDEIKNQEKLKNTIVDKTVINQSYNKTIDGINHEISKQITETKSLDGSIQTSTITTNKFVNAMGQVVTKTQSVNAAGQQTTQTMISMGKQAKHLGQTFSDIVVKVGKFYLASLPIRAVQTAITETIQAVKDFDSALTEFKKVSDLSGDSLDEYCKKLEKFGELTGRTRTEMVQMSTEFKRSGYTDEESAELAQIASLYQNVADEELSASEASAVVISQLKAFRKEGLTAMQVIDGINEVAARNAVSTSDIGRGLTQAGAALSTYGNDYTETIALITAGTEIFQGKSQQVARGLNTVASRVAKNEKALKNYGIEIYDTNGDLKSTYEILSELAPKWKEMTSAEQVALGTTLAGVNQYKVFSAVMGNFDTAIKVATEDVEYFSGSALRQNEKYMESIKAKIQALRAELQKLIFDNNVLQNAFKSLLNILTNVVKFFNSSYGKFVLMSTVLALIGNTILTKVVPAFKMIPMVVYQAWSSFTLYTAGIYSAKEALDAFTLSLNVASLNPYTIALTAILAVITATAIACYKLSKATQDHIKTLKEQQDIITETTDNIKEYQSELDEINEKIEQIKKSGTDINKDSDEILTKLRKEREELEEIVRLEQIRQEGAIKEARKQAEAIFKSSPKQGDFEGSKVASKYQRAKETKFNKYSDIDLVLGGYLSNEDFDRLYGNAKSDGDLKLADSLTLVTAKIKAYGDEFTRLSQKKESGGIWTEEDEKVLDSAKKKLDIVTLAGNDLAIMMKDTMDSTDSTATGFDEISKSYENYQNVIGNASEETKDYIGIKDELIDENDEEEESIDEVADAWKYNDEEKLQAQGILENLGLEEKDLQQQIGMSSLELARQANEWHSNGEALFHYLTNLNQLNEAIDDVQSNYKTLKSAVDEYNESGGFSVDTLQELLKLSPEYLQAIFDENGELRLQNGVLKLNEKAIKNKISAMASEAKQNIYNTAIERISNLSKDENTKEAIKNKEAYDDSTAAIKKHKDALVDDARAEYLNTIAKNRASGGSAKDTYINQIIKETEEQLALVDKMVDGLGKDFSKAMDTGTNSTKNTNNALKEQNNLLKQQKQLLQEKKKQYDDVVGYIKKKIQNEIKALEAEKKEQVNNIKDQLDTLKDLKKEELDSIQDQIDALKDQKEVEKDFWQEKIDALKEQNDELNTQLEREKLLEELAKARSKKVRVYKEGIGFVYTEDTKEVDKAREKLQEFDRKQAYEEQLKILENYKKQSEKNYEEQIKALEKFKDEREKLYEQQIKDLEAYQKQVEDDYDARIKYFQDYLDKFTQQTDAYENETNRQLAIQLTGIDFEAEGWQTRLDNLANFVEQYNALLGDIHTLDALNDDVSDTTPEITKTDIDVDTDDTDDDTKGTGGVPNNSAELSQQRRDSLGGTQQASNWYANNYGGKSGNSAPTATRIPTKSVGMWDDDSPLKKASKKASGDSYIKDDGMYLVGDSPNQELVIGSKLNGNLMNLTQGSGVVNATSTRTLAGMLNQLGFANQGVNVSNSQSKNTNINIGNISLPSVQNGKDFVDYLQNFSLQMTQEAFA